jgi:hypothetical protein
MICPLLPHSSDSHLVRIITLYVHAIGFLDLSWPWEFLDEIYEEGLVGWSTSIGYDGDVLVTPKDRLEN